MQFAEIVQANGLQMVKLPEGFHLRGNTVSIRRQGDALILEPVKSEAWPAGFFERVLIKYPAFVRPPQGCLP